MNLAIDVGNTRVKLAVFDRAVLIHSSVCEKADFREALHNVAQTYPDIQDCILASVGDFAATDLAEVRKKYSVIRLDGNTSLPFKNEYKTPATLGVDRLALVAAAVMNFPDRPALVIDAGSCITYDYVSADTIYNGGSISPGIRMRYKAMHTFTKNLPLLEPTLPIPAIGTDTKESMHSGVLQALVFEIEGFIAAYRSKYPNLTVILTGGDADFLRDSLKSDIFAHSNFLLEGLNFILEYNKHRC